jgi:xanthine dehydrogenase accessory factor
MPAWLDALAALDENGEAGVLVSVIAARGSAPREAGAKMVVSATRSWDTIGGGNLEYQSILDARAILAGDGTAPVQREFPLGPALGQCCGGATTILFEPIRPPRWTIALFGAGHVGRAIARLLGDLPCRLLWFDARPDIFPDTVASNTRLRHATEPADIAALPPGAAVLIMTHDHGTDFLLTEAALRRADLGFVGTIGSETKRARFASRLRRAGLAEDALQRLHCPIGLPGVGEKLPAEIAIAVAAQLLLARQAAAAPLAERQHGSADMTAMDRTEALPDLSAALTAAAGCGAPGCSADCGASPRPAPGRAAVLDSATAPSR